MKLLRRSMLIACACIVTAHAALAGDVSTWSPSASGNTQPPPNGMPDNVAPTRVHGIIREIMASVNRWYRHQSATTSTGSANAQVLTYNPPVTSCVSGEGYTFFPGYTNTGATTLTIGSCTSPVKIGNNALTGGELVSGRVAMVFHNGTSFQLLSGGGGSGGGGGGGVGATLTLHGGASVTLHSGTPVTFHGS